jgi:GTP:adenosylcobinamide-phosphate guanylyltransferase
MDAIVIAGGIPGPEEPLYPYTQGKHKALLDICGKSMIQWVLDALEDADTIDQVIIIGLPASSAVKGSKIRLFLENQGGILENVRAGLIKILELNPQAKHVAIVSSDIPTVRAEHINWVVNTAMQTDEDVYYNVITRPVMESRFPGSNRSFVHLKDADVCGGDLNIVRAMTVTSNEALWEKIIASRKSALKQAALLGFDTFLLLLLRQITIERAIKKVTKRMQITGRALLCPYAEVGMDVDKPHQLELVTADLCQQHKGE